MREEKRTHRSSAGLGLQGLTESKRSLACAAVAASSGKGGLESASSVSRGPGSRQGGPRPVRVFVLLLSGAAVSSERWWELSVCPHTMRTAVGNRKLCVVVNALGFFP